MPCHRIHLGIDLLSPILPAYSAIAPCGHKSPHHNLPKKITDRSTRGNHIPHIKNLTSNVKLFHIAASSSGSGRKGGTRIKTTNTINIPAWIYANLSLFLTKKFSISLTISLIR